MYLSGKHTYSMLNLKQKKGFDQINSHEWSNNMLDVHQKEFAIVTILLINDSGLSKQQENDQ